jgi:hypothetical protein
MMLTNHLHPVLRFKMHGTVTPSPIHNLSEAQKKKKNSIRVTGLLDGIKEMTSHTQSGSVN